MSLPTLIEHFDNDLQLPRNPARIRDYTLENRFGCAKEIEYNLFDLSSANINGFYVLYEYEHQAQGPLKRAVIVINNKAPVYWRRFAAIKELIHVFDRDEHQFADEENIRALLREMEFPYDIIQAGHYDDDPDGRAVIPALALCVPKRIRSEMRAKLITASPEEAVKLKEEFCEKFEIPFRYKNFIFSEDFDGILMDILKNYYE